jgi:hypothetical protein
MVTSLPAGVRAMAPMSALFLASFSLTLAMQPPSEGLASTPEVPPRDVLIPASIWTPGRNAESPPGDYVIAMPQAAQDEPTLRDLVADSDPGTSAEAQVLLALLDQESSVE